jgi:hypothetical protein
MVGGQKQPTQASPLRFRSTSGSFFRKGRAQLEQASPFSLTIFFEIGIGISGVEVILAREQPSHSGESPFL